MLAQGLEPGFEFGEPGAELAGVEVAGLESVVVAVEGAVAPPDLLGDRASPLVERWPLGGLFLVGAVERSGDQVAIAIQLGELIEHRGLELVPVQAFTVAAFPSQLLPARAGVVEVGSAVACRAHPDVGALAASAADDSGEQEVRAVAAPQRQVLAPLLEQRLRRLEGGLVDEGVVQAGVALAAPVHPAEIGLVLEQPLDGSGLPAASRRRRTLLSEQSGDRGRAQPVTRVQLEDTADDRGFPLVRDDVLIVVAAVAERQLPRRPATLLRAALDASGNAVDDRRVLELREHRQHLQHHPTRRRTRIKRLRRRTKSDTESVELLGELRELPHLPRKAIDAVHQEQIDLPLARELQRCLQARPVELRPRRPILLVGDHVPALLRAHERFQPLQLGMQRGRLVLLIRRDPRVQTHTQSSTPPLLKNM